ncbi:MAG: cysteine synthase A [Bacteroidales bacterium]|nr:cysteine synthase A [Bacteroidales bacterium]MBD5224143.1 cysteine synthase A [Bacteroidales bacterium]
MNHNKLIGQNIADSLTDLIGNTPLVELHNIEKEIGFNGRLLAKLESFNPGGSAKDRIALAMIEDAEVSGRLKPGGTIIEPTSGNTGIGLAWIGAMKGYNVILTMPDTMSAERRQLLKAYGARLELTPGKEGMKGAIARARELQEEIPGAIIMEQFDNPANPRVHELTTAREILRDTAGNVDILVAGVGTGGTVSGTARGIKKEHPELLAVAVEPASSPVLEGGAPGPHKIQGIGAGFVPRNYDETVIDKVMAVTDEDAVKGARLLIRKEGILAGISSGAAISAAISIAKLSENEGKTIVVVLPDTGERYLSTPLFNE